MMYSHGYGFGDMIGGHGFVGLLMLLFGLLVLAGLVLLIVWAVRASSGQYTQAGPVATPTDAGHAEAIAIAKRRFASGEITKEQYEEIMRSLAG